MGEKIVNKDAGRSLVQRVRRGGHLEGMKRGRTAYHLDGLMIVAKDAEWLKMTICN